MLKVIGMGASSISCFDVFARTGFCSLKEELIVELDGSQCLSQEDYDEERTKYIETGVEELDQEKLSPLLVLKYQALDDA